MKKPFALFALFLLLAAALPADAERSRKTYSTPDLADKRYYVCKADSDCAIAHLPCGRVVVVNTFTQDDVQGWYDFVAPHYKCLAAAGRQQAENIACVNNMCKADITQVPTALPDTPETRNPAYCETPEDCAVVTGPCNKKIFVNKKHRQPLQAEYDRLLEKRPENCTWPDNRTVGKLTCVRNTCGGELDIPDQNYWSDPVDMRKMMGDRAE